MTVNRFDGIPLQTLDTLKRIERVLERQSAEVLTVEEDRGRYGYFSSVWGPGNLPRLTLRWHPGTEGLFPTFDQMAAAKSLWPKAEEWDFSTMAGNSHIFGIPLRFDLP